MEPQDTNYFTFKSQFLKDFSVLKNMSFPLEEEEDFHMRLVFFMTTAHQRLDGDCIGVWVCVHVCMCIHTHFAS